MGRLYQKENVISTIGRNPIRAICVAFKISPYGRNDSFLNTNEVEILMTNEPLN